MINIVDRYNLEKNIKNEYLEVKKLAAKKYYFFLKQALKNDKHFFRYEVFVGEHHYYDYELKDLVLKKFKSKNKEVYDFLILIFPNAREEYELFAKNGKNKCITKFEKIGFRKLEIADGRYISTNDYKISYSKSRRENYSPLNSFFKTSIDADLVNSKYNDYFNEKLNNSATSFFLKSSYL